MRIVEVVGDEKIEYIKDLLVYLRMKNQKKVSTKSVLSELKKMGVVTNYEDLSPLIDHLDFIEDINDEYITFTDTVEKSVSSEEKIELDKDTVKSMADRARRRRER